MMKGSDLENIIEQDARLVEIVQPISILGSLEWPAEVKSSFLDGWNKGNPVLPVVDLQQQDFSVQIEALGRIQSNCNREHPLENLIYKTARSYISAARMLETVGAPGFVRYSSELYGKPDDIYKVQDWTALDAADFFLCRSDELLGSYVVPETVTDIPVEIFAERLQQQVDDFFVDDKVSVVIDPTLSAKAIAGADRIRLRTGAMYSDLDLRQLLEHEAYIHAATKHNGRRQHNLRLLSLGSPRTTRTQEGLAVFAELITLSIDILRLRRISLRVKAIAMVLDGADFIETFKYFLESGQSEEESYQSAVRCFRGCPVTGGLAFTKDTVYLKGLMEVYGFLATVIHENRPELINILFAGRMSLGDAVELQPFFESGFLVAGHYMPHWASDLRILASVLACNAYFTRVDLTHVKLENFIRLEEDTAMGNN